MTYLELVNNVLRRLRETEVTTVQSTSYSKLIGDIVNDAKRLVEDAWDWKVLNTATFIMDIPDVPDASNPGGYQNVQELDIELKGSGLTPKVKKEISALVESKKIKDMPVKEPEVVEPKAKETKSKK